MILGLLRDHKIYKYILYIIYIYLPFNRGVANLFRLFLNIEVSECILFWDWISTKAWMSSPLPNYLSKTFETLPKRVEHGSWHFDIFYTFSNIQIKENDQSRSYSIVKFGSHMGGFGWVVKLLWRGSVREVVCIYDITYTTIPLTKH